MRSAFLFCLVLAVLFVNGWTDAPNSIATVVATKTLSFRRATLLAAGFELLGVLITSLLCPTVAQTVFSIADFGNDPDTAWIALQSALLAIVLWAVLAWRFGIPTSESHALLAGLTGAAIALHGGLTGVSGEAWVRVLVGLLLSTLCGTLSGRFAARHLALNRLTRSQARCGQLICAAAMAFFHGAQDGQKFLALLLLVRALTWGQLVQVFTVSPALAALCALVMAAGVLCGGKRIIDTVTQGMNGWEDRRGLAVDLAGSVCLLLASLLGFPVSTTHTKIAALLGASAAFERSALPRSTVLRVSLVWLATFPCVGLLAWCLTRLMIG